VDHGLSLIVSLVTPRPELLALAVTIDMCLGDPFYAWHPIRLIGRLLTWLEARLRAIGADGYAGGIALFLLLTGLSVSVLVALAAVANAVGPLATTLLHVFALYSLLALGDLLHHVWRIESALSRNDLSGARAAASLLVGRDTDRMDVSACRRAGVESLSENLADGFVSPVLWYGVGGVAGLLVFKIVSTMDSMVGYKSPRYLRFGWCGARLDDAMNYVPARITWLAITVVAAMLPRASGVKAWRIGLEQHGVLLGPNAGWSEAATAGALQCRLVGPIWLHGTLVTDKWIGAPSDPPLSTRAELVTGMVLVATTGVTIAAGVCLLLFSLQGFPRPPF
jgi:adenosylcobinamide-phosphate synthase